MNPNLDTILGNLKKVRGRNGNWVACCPAHEDRSPSMTIRETADGTILMHCFAGCSIGAIAEALSVDLSDLFPPKEGDHRPPVRRRFIAADLLKVIAFEARVVAVCASDMARGIELSPEDRSRLQAASARVLEALEMADV
jgi:hypothetical protein